MNTQKLKELFVEWQSAKVDSHYPTITFEESDTLEASFSALTDRLEAAERRVAELENDESRQRLANAEHQLYMKDLAINNIKASRKAQFEKRQAAERERDELRKTLQATQDGATEAIKHAMRLQEDIARRDAAAAAAAADILRWDAEKPIAEVAESFIYFLRKQPNGERWPVGTKLYTAAPPAVLPPDVIYKAQHIASVLEMIGSFDSDDIDSDTVDLRFEVDGVDTGSDASITEYATKGAEIIRSLVMGAQQQKVVELPTLFTVIGENIRSQDNRCTADPIFCVFEKVPTPAAEGYNHTRIEWYDSDHDRDATPLQAARLEALFEGGRCDDNDYKCWRRLAMHDVDTFVTACFTAKGCEDYLAQNGHNLRRPFVYVTSAYRNDEYKAVREWLMQLAAAPAPGGDGG